MAIDRAKTLVETALIELEYLAADALFSDEGHSVDEDNLRVGGLYRTACIELLCCLDVIEQAKTETDKIAAAA